MSAFAEVRAHGHTLVWVWLGAAWGSEQGAVAEYQLGEGQSAQDVPNQKPVSKYHISMTSFL